MNDRDIARFMTKVHRRTLNECWPWKAGTNLNGYGQMRVGFKKIGAHRLSWEIHNGSIPHGMHVLHCCDNRLCVNPSHLFLGTHADNMRDRVAKNRSARGERHGRYTHPERTARGNSHGRKVSPEKTARGEAHGRAQLKQTDILDIRSRYFAGNITQQSLADEYGVDRTTIGRIVTNKTWRN